MDVLTVDQAARRGRFKIAICGTILPSLWELVEIWQNGRCPFDLAHQTDVYTVSKQVFTLDQGVCKWTFKIVKAGTFLLAPWEPVEIWGNG